MVRPYDVRLRSQDPTEGGDRLVPQVSEGQVGRAAARPGRRRYAGTS